MQILAGWTFENYEGVLATLALRHLGKVDEQMLQWVAAKFEGSNDKPALVGFLKEVGKAGGSESIERVRSLSQKVLAIYPKGGEEVKAECLDFFMDTFGNRPELKPIFEECKVLEVVGRIVNLRGAGEMGEEVQLNWKRFGEYVDGGWN